MAEEDSKPPSMLLPFPLKPAAASPSRPQIVPNFQIHDFGPARAAGPSGPLFILDRSELPVPRVDQDEPVFMAREVLPDFVPTRGRDPALSRGRGRSWSSSRVSMRGRVEGRPCLPKSGPNSSLAPEAGLSIAKMIASRGRPSACRAALPLFVFELGAR